MFWTLLRGATGKAVCESLFGRGGRATPTTQMVSVIPEPTRQPILLEVSGLNQEKPELISEQRGMAWAKVMGGGRHDMKWAAGKNSG